VPPTDFRALQREDTKRRILAAVNELLVEGHPATLSFPAVARRAEVSVPTVYRYFPNKEALLDAAAESIDARTREWLGQDAPVPGEMLYQFIHRSWHELAANLPAVRASHLTSLGRDLRSRRNEGRRRNAVGTAIGGGVDPTTEDGERLVRAILTIASSSTLLEQVDRLGLTVDQAVDDVVWIIEAITAATREGQSTSGEGGHDRAGRRRRQPPR
jgi:AcrR family transcriptional regulator